MWVWNISQKYTYYVYFSLVGDYNLLANHTNMLSRESKGQDQLEHGFWSIK